MSKCDNCDKTITKKSPGLECNKCSKIVHANQLCTGLSSKQLSALRNAENLEWKCEECHKESPHRKSFIIPDDDENEDGNVSELDGNSAAVNKLLRDISAEVKKAVKKELASVNESLSNCCLRMNAINSTLEILAEKVKDMEKKNTYLTNQNTHLELKIDALEQHIRNVEQETLANVLEITGIPDNENENLDILSTKIASKLNIEKRQVTMVKRLKGRNGKEGVIQVMLQHEEQVDQWIRTARKEKIVASDVVPEGDTDLWTFQEIAFKAEMDRHDDPESEEEAFVLCAEDPATRTRNIVELRNMIYERGECHPHRMDDAYLLRFLRARRSVPARAHRLLVRYTNFRDQNPHLWRDVDWFSLTKLGHVFEGVLFDRPDVGRLILCRLGEWNPDDYPVDDLIRGSMLLLEIGIMQPKLQILGGTALLDCAGLTMKHMRQFSPAIALQAMNVMGFAFPLHMREVHVINCSRIFETLFNLFKRLAPVDDLWKRVRFHGSDLGALHEYIPPECLPKRYGGHRQEVSLERWLTKIKQYKNKDFDNDMRNLGYAVD